jgi:hypothetical protein
MIKCEDDLWRIFGGEDHEKIGRRSLPFSVVWHELHDYEALHREPVSPNTSAKAPKKKSSVPQTDLEDVTRFYLLVGRERQVCVDQSRLIKVGKAMRDRELSVQYLGMIAAT